VAPRARSTAVNKSDAQKLAALARKYDSTLPPETEDDLERRAFFSEMKKREF